MNTPSLEASTFMVMSPRTRVIAIERVHRCADLLRALPEKATRDECIDILNEHLYEVFKANYDHPIKPFTPKAKPKPLTLSLKLPTLKLRLPS